MTKDQSKIIVVNGLVCVAVGVGGLLGMAFGNEPPKLIDYTIDLSVLLIIMNVLFLRKEWKSALKR